VAEVDEVVRFFSKTSATKRRLPSSSVLIIAPSSIQF